MATTRCLACDRPVEDDANYCPACGAPRDATIFIDPLAESVDTDEVVGSKRSRLTSIVVPFVVIGLLIGGIAALVASGDDTADDDQDETLPAPTPEVEETATPAPTSTPAPDPAPVEVVTNGDPWQPLPTDATHLVVAWGRSVGFLDLETGEWIIHGLSEPVLADGPTNNTWAGPSMSAFGADAVILTSTIPSGAAVVSLSEGQRDLDLPEARYIGAGADKALFVGTPLGRLVVTEVAPDGSTANWPDALPILSSPIAVNDDGELLTFAGGAIFATSADGGRLLTRSAPRSRQVEGRLLVESCNDGFQCFVSVLDIDTGGIIPTDLSGVVVQLRRDGSLLVSSSEIGDPAVARIAQNGRYEIDPENDLLLGPIEVRADDGLTAVVGSGGIQLFDRDDNERVRMDVEDMGCCPEPTIATFVTLSG